MKNNILTATTAPLEAGLKSCSMEVLDRVFTGDQLCHSRWGDTMISTQVTEGLRKRIQTGDKLQAKRTIQAIQGQL